MKSWGFVAFGILCGGPAVAGGTSVVEVYGRKAAGVVEALSAGVEAAGGTEDRIQCEVGNVECRVSEEARSPAEARFAKCTSGGNPFLKGSKAARLHFALERAGAVSRTAKGKRRVRVRDVTARNSTTGSTASFTDENATRK
jgi:hypothetical protein